VCHGASPCWPCRRWSSLALQALVLAGLADASPRWPCRRWPWRCARPTCGHGTVLAEAAATAVNFHPVSRLLVRRGAHGLEILEMRWGQRSSRPDELGLGPGSLGRSRGGAPDEDAENGSACKRRRRWHLVAQRTSRGRGHGLEESRLGGKWSGGAVDPCWTRPSVGHGGMFSGRPQPCPGAKLDLSFSTQQG
jgi:hypothetical protein